MVAALLWVGGFLVAGWPVVLGIAATGPVLVVPVLAQVTPVAGAVTHRP